MRTNVDGAMDRIRTLVSRLVEDAETRKAMIGAVEGAYNLGVIAGLEEAMDAASTAFNMAAFDEKRPQ